MKNQVLTEGGIAIALRAAIEEGCLTVAEVEKIAGILLDAAMGLGMQYEIDRDEGRRAEPLMRQRAERLDRLAGAFESATEAKVG